jgi:5-methylcytosine-specific restriction endonuclease McrA
MPSLDRLHRPVLVLNASYEPINICAARRALVLVLKGVASAEEESQAHVHSPRHSIRVPSVIRLLEYRRIPHQTRALSRKNILMRDRYTCQYCHRTMPSGELTLDHVVPRSRAGETTWENLVACCHPCNNRKGSRTPEEAGMKLARAPRPFSLHTSRHLMRLLAKSDDQWRKYLFYLKEFRSQNSEFSGIQGILQILELMRRGGAWPGSLGFPWEAWWPSPD